MFTKIFPTSLATLALAAALTGVVPTAANAQHFSTKIGYGHDKGRIELYIGKYGQKNHYRGKKKKHRGHYSVCRPGHAVHKAERRGLRHARIGTVNNRFVIVKGRHHGSKVRVAFYRNSGRCDVAWIKRSKRGNYYRVR